MKKFFQKLIQGKLLYVLNSVLEHRLFTPATIVIIVSFFLYRGFEFVQDAMLNYRDSKVAQQVLPVTIDISGDDVKLDFTESQVFDYRVKSGDTLLKILLDLGVKEADVSEILDATKKVFNPGSIGVGDQVTINYDVKLQYNKNQINAPESDINRQIIVSQVSISPSIEETIIVSRNQNNRYEVKKDKVKLSRHISRYYGTIKNGLFVDGVRSGISPTSMMNMINLYGYDIDFQRDIHDGDKFEMLVESFYSEDGKKIKDGNVLFSSLTMRNKSIDIYMHKVKDRIEYFDASGNSVKKSLLRTPINGARVSSGFGMRRHPILGYSRMHKGTDFAASTGTPILAAGNGVITHFGIKGGYGNYVRIQHNPDYSTAYGHASRFNKKFRLGAKVKQGDVVAYVGTTGRSTGPHLHFEVLYKGSQINPAKVKATSGIKLGGKELAAFKLSKAEIDRYRSNIPNQVR